MLYNRCAEVDDKFWRDLARAEPEDIFRRTGIRRQQQVFCFSFL